MIMSRPEAGDPETMTIGDLEGTQFTARSRGRTKARSWPTGLRSLQGRPARAGRPAPRWGISPAARPGRSAGPLPASTSAELADAVVVADQQDRRDARRPRPGDGPAGRPRRRGTGRFSSEIGGAGAPSRFTSGASVWRVRMAVEHRIRSGRGPRGRYGRPWPWPPARRARSGGDRGRPAGDRSRPISHAAGEAGSSQGDPVKIVAEQDLIELP